MPTPSSPSALRKAAPYLAIAAACFALAWCSFSGGTDDTLQTPAAQSSTTSPQSTSASTNNILPTAPATQAPAEPDLKDHIKALEASGALPKLDRSTDIKGPDQNLNGVRDDIDAWIAALPITEVQKRAATQEAAAMQKKLLVDLHDMVAQQVISDENSASITCLSNVFMPNYEEGFTLVKKIEAMTANTKERSIRYIQYNRARSGSVTGATKGEPCK